MRYVWVVLQAQELERIAECTQSLAEDKMTAEGAQVRTSVRPKKAVIKMDV